MNTDSENVCAVIVTWNIGEGFISNFKAVLDQVARTIIIDNGSDPETVLMLKRLHKKYPDRIDVVYNERNMGIASAQNHGVDFALKNGFKWILLLDHDSRPENGMVLSMLKAFYSIKEKSKVGLVAPYIREENIAREMKFLSSDCPFKLRTFGNDSIVTDVQSVISSGSLIRKEVFESIGKFRHDFFVDYVDTEFCMRMKVNGWKIAVVRDAVLNHNIGELKGHRLLGRMTGVTNHSSSRRYTIFRNRVIVWKQYFNRLPSYILFDIAMAFYDAIKILLFENARQKKIKAIFKGLFTGTVNR
jgi:rhamnosyltransferase